MGRGLAKHSCLIHFVRLINEMKLCVKSKAWMKGESFWGLKRGENTGKYFSKYYALPFILSFECYSTAENYVPTSRSRKLKHRRASLLGKRLNVPQPGSMRAGSSMSMSKSVRLPNWNPGNYGQGVACREKEEIIGIFSGKSPCDWSTL
jgi:hypothetical protein